MNVHFVQMHNDFLFCEGRMIDFVNMKSKVLPEWTLGELVHFVSGHFHYAPVRELGYCNHFGQRGVANNMRDLRAASLLGPITFVIPKSESCCIQ